jgi:hypothetical protein
MVDPQMPVTNIFGDVPERNTGDNLIRTSQQHHVQLSAMADLKANIVITVSSVILTFTMGRINDPELKVSAIILLCFTSVALILAILAVLPKYRPLRLNGKPLPPHFNLLFFGHFAELPRERFLEDMARAMRNDGSAYEAMAKDLYSLGVYLAHYKYPYLRAAYLFFLSGFLLAGLEQIWRLSTH